MKLSTSQPSEKFRLGLMYQNALADNLGSDFRINPNCILHGK